jgi:uncharacterized protein (DUF486 family)
VYTLPIDPAILLRTTVLLTLSNVFMTFAWYGHLRSLGSKPWYVAAVAAWGVALFEYLLQVPANRIGYNRAQPGGLTLPQLKILQEVLTLAVFVPFAVFYMRQGVSRDYAYAALCVLAAAYFVFRSKG